MTEHTPTPWHLDGLYVTNREPPTVGPSIADCGRSPRIERAQQVANAAFIVKAVNNHEALVAELHRLHALCGHQQTADILSRVGGVGT